MDDSSGKFKEVYSNLKDIPQQIEKNTEIMKDVSRDVNESISHLSELLSDIQGKTDKLDSIEMSIKMMKDQFFNAVPRDNEFSKDLGLTEKQAEQIITTGSLSGGLMLYAIKLAKDNKKLLSLSNLASALKIAGTYDYFYGYYVAMTAIGMVTCKLDPNNMLKVQEYDKSLNTLQEKLTQRVANDPDFENQFKLVDEFIDKLIENNFDCKKSYDSYIDSWKKITEFYESIYKEKMLYHADIEAHKILGNQLLRYFKDERYMYYSIEQIIQDLYYLLSQNEEREKNFLQMYVFNKDLSIYAKREYAFKQKFSNHIERGM